MSIEAMKQWLAAIERANALDGMYSWQDEEDSLRQAIAEAEKQEPVAYSDETGKVIWLKGVHKKTNLYERPQPAQPKREWVGLTDDDIRPMCGQEWVFETVKQWVEVIESKLKEKNP